MDSYTETTVNGDEVGVIWIEGWAAWSTQSHLGANGPFGSISDALDALEDEIDDPDIMTELRLRVAKEETDES
jgi:hypothetical protein